MTPASFTPASPLRATERARQLLNRGDDRVGLIQLSALIHEAQAQSGKKLTTGASKFEISFDIKFTHIGEPISPAITAPPTN